MKTLLSLVIICIANLLYAQQFRALVFSKTDGWHHESINDGVDALRALAQRHEFSLDWEENAGRVFTDEYLKKYDVVIFLMTTGDVLNDVQQKVFERFIQAGKGYVGIHSASDTEYDWAWYTRLVGMMFHIHPKNQTALIKVEDRNFPGMQLMPDTRWWTDEWYEFGAPKSDKLKYLLSVDESTYDVNAQWSNKKAKGMGFHPISWYQEYDGGRSFYTALGHMPDTYSDAIFLEHLFGGIFWSATGKGILKE